jgi:ribosome biogenesis GTPase / thiamine phosphate phosphatase
MKTQHSELKELGWNDWFEQRAECGPTDTVARVAAVDRDQWLLVDCGGHFRAKLTGSYLYRRHLSHELPCVGDWVCVEKQPGEDFGVIHGIMGDRPRFNPFLSSVHASPTNFFRIVPL